MVPSLSSSKTTYKRDMRVREKGDESEREHTGELHKITNTMLCSSIDSCNN
jgi:hypothetical protein